MSYNGSGTFNINSTGQPVVAGTVITASAFNALTTDLATGLTTAITKDGQTTTTARITFAQGITSSLVTDSSSVSTGSIITDGGMGVAKNLYVGGTLNVTGSTSLTNPVINNIKMGYTTTATAAGTTTLTVASNYRQFFTGSTTQTIVLPVTSTLVTGMAYEIENNSTGLLTVNSSGGNLVGTIPAGVCAHAVCIGTTLTTAADWDWDYISTTTITGTGANVLGTSPTITTPTISSLSSAAATALTLQSAGTTAITVDTSQNVLVGTTTTTNNLRNGEKVAVVTTGGNQGGASLTTYSGTGAGNGVILDIQRSRGTTDGSMTAVASGDTLGYILFRGSDGTSFQDSSYITAQVDGAVSGGTVPGRLAFITSGSERMRIDSSGNVGIGTTAPSFAGGSSGVMISGVKPALRLSSTTTGAGSWEIYADSASSGGLGFYERQNSSTAMYLDEGGNLLVGTTNASFTSGVGMKMIPDASGPAIVCVGTATSASFNSYFIYSTGAGANRFYVSYAGQIYATSTGITAISDVTLKENIRDLETGLDEIMALRPRRFDWKEETKLDQKNVAGFIAQEVEPVLPDLVYDYKYNEQTTKKAVKTSDMLPTLVKAIQELKAINDTQAETINALTARIVALENA